jgi:hypothetical protein
MVTGLAQRRDANKAGLDLSQSPSSSDSPKRFWRRHMEATAPARRSGGHDILHSTSSSWLQTMATASITSPLSPWYAAYPTPRKPPATICREDVLDMIKESAKTSNRDYILVDLRRNDYEVILITTL